MFGQLWARAAELGAVVLGALGALVVVCGAAVEELPVEVAALAIAAAPPAAAPVTASMAARALIRRLISVHLLSWSASGVSLTIHWTRRRCVGRR
jgi:hypothetical protein